MPISLRSISLHSLSSPYLSEVEQMYTPTINLYIRVSQNNSFQEVVNTLEPLYFLRLCEIAVLRLPLSHSFICSARKQAYCFLSRQRYGSRAFYKLMQAVEADTNTFACRKQINKPKIGLGSIASDYHVGHGTVMSQYLPSLP